ncbi:SHOCT domain-containing protein [Methanospirillum stamsii]|nr:SHOCT domain-containing protein [Methanospirillum stamsii]
MTDEDPLSIVQVRYARGEIDTAEYEEFLSWFLKNIAFQQVPSLKIASERYANGEISIGQYKEILSHLIADISNYQQSAPLRIVHLRYAEGELKTGEFEEKISVLMKDIPAYPHSPPLAVLFTRYAKGEIDDSEYKEMLAHLATYCSPSLPKMETPAPAESVKNQTPPSKPSTTPPVQKPSPTPSAAKPPQEPPSPDPYRLNFAAMQNPVSQAVISSDSLRIHADIDERLQSDRDLQDLLPDQVMPDEQAVLLQTAGDSTAKSDMYHITDLQSSPVPVTILVSEAGLSRKTIDSLKQDILEAKNLKEKPILSVKKEQNIQPQKGKETDKTGSKEEHQKIKELIRQGKYQESIIRLDELLKQTPDDYRSLFLKSISLFNIGKGDEALDLLSNAKESCTNIEDEKEIERIYNHIVQKGNEKKPKQESDTNDEREKPGTNEPEIKPILTGYKNLTNNEQSEIFQKISRQAQEMIDSGDYSGANTLLADLSEMVKEIPPESIQKESIDELFAAKGFVLYQLREYCEARKCFKEATRINPKNETAIHYLTDIRIRDCSKFVRHV